MGLISMRQTGSLKYAVAWSKERIEVHFVHKNIKWKFNPPADPHFEGMWNRLIINGKKATYVVFGKGAIREYFLLTIMCLCELTLKARPRTPVTSDVSDLEGFTPNHSLIGEKCLSTILTLRRRVLAMLESSSDNHKLTQ